MISILIPVYNVYVYELIESLSQQLASTGIAGEIIVLDDASDPEYLVKNESIKTLPFVEYNQLPINYGRARIRQELSALARFSWLLFIDSDSRIISNSYLENYILLFKNRYEVISGGRVYPFEKPIKCCSVLHWKYGKVREDLHSNKKAGFQSNNFCIKKEIFDKLDILNELKDYGHEDTMMGILMEKMDVKVTNIHNPVLHERIEDAEVFIKKSDDALMNLLTIRKLLKETDIKKHIKIYRWFSLVKKCHLRRLIISFYKKFNKSILTNLTSCNPNLSLFDLHRLSKLLIYDRELEKTE